MSHSDQAESHVGEDRSAIFMPAVDRARLGINAGAVDVAQLEPQTVLQPREAAQAEEHGPNLKVEAMQERADTVGQKDNGVMLPLELLPERSEHVFPDPYVKGYVPVYDYFDE